MADSNQPVQNRQPGPLTRLVEVIVLCGKLGVIGFGGPAAHIAMLEEEAVTRRRWLTREHFLDLVGATNLIPGPNSTEMMIHVGYLRAGWPGLLAAGLAFVFPAVALTTLLAWMYVTWGGLPAIAPLLQGIKPAILAVILGALWRLGRTASKPAAPAPERMLLAALGLGVAAAVLLGAEEIAALLLGGLIGMLLLQLLRQRLHPPSLASLFLLTFLPGQARGRADLLSWLAALLPAVGPEVSLGRLAWFFLKVGSVLYGSGYVLVAFLEGDLVHNYGWLTQQQLLDAIAIGQFTPGPVLSTSAFIGYVLAGPPGAVVSAAAIFAPSFVFVALLNPLVPRLRRSPWMAAFLDAVNVSAVGLMAAVLLRLAANVLVGWPAVVIALLAALGVLRLRLSSAWIVLGGAVLGLLFGWAA